MSNLKKEDIFKKLSKKERIYTIDSVVKSRSEVTIFQKGTQKKTTLKAYDHAPRENKIFLSNLYGKANQFLNAILNFESRNVHYFAKGKLIKVDNENLEFVYTDEFYKCEQRKNFRISADDLKSFSIKIDGTIYNGHDLSVGGAALSVEGISSFPNKIGDKLENVTVNFNKISIQVPNSMVIHRTEIYKENSEMNLFKIGIKFLDLNESEEGLIFRELNQSLFETLG